MTISNGVKKIKNNFRAMGTDISVEIIVDKADMVDSAEKDMQTVKNIFAKNEKIFSRFLPDSELSKINSNLGREIKVSREMFEVLKLCLEFNEVSWGYFDPRIIGNLEKIGYDRNFREMGEIREIGEISPEGISGRLEDDLILDSEKSIAIFKKRMDTTGIVKGYTVDEAADFLKREGWQNFLIDAGGDMFVQGFNKEGEDWRIGIEGLEDEKIMLKLHNQGIATSGISRKKWEAGGKKFHHLINPMDPENFSCDLKTVTVIKEKTVEADGRAKVLFLMGKEKGLEFANSHNLKALFLDYKNNVYLSEAMKEKVWEEELSS